MPSLDAVTPGPAAGSRARSLWAAPRADDATTADGATTALDAPHALGRAVRSLEAAATRAAADLRLASQKKLRESPFASGALSELQQLRWQLTPLEDAAGGARRPLASPLACPSHAR
eukprot:1284845-Prymnesium_polylepis.1